VPIGTPAAVIQKLSKLLVAGGKNEKVLQLMKSFGVDDTAMTFEETQKLYKEESPIWLEAVTEPRACAVLNARASTRTPRPTSASSG
jgi:tripartite-type tricarboxylate transporter receptor subunit TctC